jgi:hypothetical protein
MDQKPTTQTDTDTLTTTQAPDSEPQGVRSDDSNEPDMPEVP